MSVLEALRDHVREHRSGMAFDLAFAVIYVAVVSALFDLLGAPAWARYLALLGGVVAYFGFVASLQVARERT